MAEAAPSNLISKALQSHRRLLRGPPKVVFTSNYALFLSDTSTDTSLNLKAIDLNQKLPDGSETIMLDIELSNLPNSNQIKEISELLQKPAAEFKQIGVSVEKIEFMLVVNYEVPFRIKNDFFYKICHPDLLEDLRQAFKQSKNLANLQIRRICLRDLDQFTSSWINVLNLDQSQMDQEELTEEQQLLRERQRCYSMGITNFNYHAKSSQLSFHMGNMLCRAELPDVITNHSVKPVIVGDRKNDNLGSRMSPAFTPDGKFILFERGGDIWASPVTAETEWRLTSETKKAGSRTAGAVDFIISEEFNRYTGFWIAPEVNENQGLTQYSVLYLVCDNSNVVSKSVPSTKLEETSTITWPCAGEDNATSEVWVLTFTVSAADDSYEIEKYRLKTSVQTQFPWNEYIVRAGWTKWENKFWIQLLDRPQEKSELVLYDLEKHCLLETSDGMDVDAPETFGWVIAREHLPDCWIQVEDTTTFLKDGFVFSSRQRGGRNLYHYKVDFVGEGVEVNYKALTHKKNDGYPVKANVAMRRKIFVDEPNRLVYYVSMEDCQEHVWVATLDEYRPNQRVTEKGFHHQQITFSAERNLFYCSSSNVDTPYRVTFAQLTPSANPQGENLVEVKSLPPLPLMRSKHFPEIPRVKHELFQLDTDDGFTLNCAILRPKGTPPFPTVLIVYGGPTVALVKGAYVQKYHVRAHLLRSQGFLVALCDNRGTSCQKGVKFARSLKHKMGLVEVQDYITCINHLVEKGLTDPERVGIHGWSYGGYISLMALAQRPDVFKIAISGAPVTHWKFYDTGYTERYMGVPKDYADEYDKSSVMYHASNFPDEENRLCIIHGVADENVHFIHTRALIQSLINYQKPYVLKILPCERHGIRKQPNVVHVETFILKHFANYLNKDLEALKLSF